MSVQLHNRYALGEFELDCAKYLLKRNNQNLHLPDLPFQVLRYLVEHRERYVSRDELLERFWQGSSAYEETLTKCISTIRSQLNDQPNAPSYIATRKKVGYRYIGPFTETPASSSFPGDAPTVEIERTRGLSISIEEDDHQTRDSTTPQPAITLEKLPDVTMITTPGTADVASPRRAFDQTKRPKSVAVVISGVAMLAAATTLIWYFAHARATPLSEKDTILLADFVNTTGDTVFDGTLKQALTVQLQQTPFLTIFPEEDVLTTLKMMERSPAESVTRQIAIEICQRRKLKAMVIGTIAPLGARYVLTLEAINAQTGVTLASQQIEAQTKEEILRALGTAALNLRKQLGESLTTIQKYNAPIEEATTSSLDALKAYSMGVEEFYLNHHQASIPWFRRAIELDPNFAEAYQYLAWDSVNPAKAAEVARRAFELRGRVTQREQFDITDTYYTFVTGELEQANQSDELEEQIYTNEFAPHAVRAGNLANMGDFERSIAEAHEVIRLNPETVRGDRYLFVALERLSRFDEALDVIRQAQLRKPDDLSFRSHQYQIEVVKGDTAAMQEQVQSMNEHNERPDAFVWQARAASFGGRWREAQDLYRRAIELESDNPAVGRPGRWSLEIRQWGSLFGSCKPSETSGAFDFSRIVSPREILFVPILADGSLCGNAQTAERFANELQNRFPKATLENGISLPVIRGAIALQRNHPEEAIELLKAAAPYEGGAGFVSTYLRGQAYLRLNRGVEAEEEFQKILDHRGWGPLSPLYPLAYLSLGRAAALSGHTDQSRKAYEYFLNLWKDADQDLPILIEARMEYEKTNQSRAN